MAKKKTSLQKITSVFQNECARSIAHDNADACNVNMPSGLSNEGGRKSPGSFSDSFNAPYDGEYPVMTEGFTGGELGERTNPAVAGGWLATAHAEVVNFNRLAKSLTSNEIKFNPELEEYAATPKDVIIQLNKLSGSITRLEKAAVLLKKKRNQNKRKNNGENKNINKFSKFLGQKIDQSHLREDGSMAIYAGRNAYISTAIKEADNLSDLIEAALDGRAYGDLSSPKNLAPQHLRNVKQMLELLNWTKVSAEQLRANLQRVNKRFKKFGQRDGSHCALPFPPFLCDITPDEHLSGYGPVNEDGSAAYFNQQYFDSKSQIEMENRPGNNIMCEFAKSFWEALNNRAPGQSLNNIKYGTYPFDSAPDHTHATLGLIKTTRKTTSIRNMPTIIYDDYELFGSQSAPTFLEDDGETPSRMYQDMLDGHLPCISIDNAFYFSVKRNSLRQQGYPTAPVPLDAGKGEGEGEGFTIDEVDHFGIAHQALRWLSGAGVAGFQENSARFRSLINWEIVHGRHPFLTFEAPNEMGISNGFDCFHNGKSVVKDFLWNKSGIQALSQSHTGLGGHYASWSQRRRTLSVKVPPDVGFAGASIGITGLIIYRTDRAVQRSGATQIGLLKKSLRKLYKCAEDAFKSLNQQGAGISPEDIWLYPQAIPEVVVNGSIQPTDYFIRGVHNRMRRAYVSAVDTAGFVAHEEFHSFWSRILAPPIHPTKTEAHVLLDYLNPNAASSMMVWPPPYNRNEWGDSVWGNPWDCPRHEVYNCVPWFFTDDDPYSKSPVTINGVSRQYRCTKHTMNSYIDQLCQALLSGTVNDPNFDSRTFEQYFELPHDDSCTSGQSLANVYQLRHCQDD